MDVLNARITQLLAFSYSHYLDLIKEKVWELSSNGFYVFKTLSFFELLLQLRAKLIKSYGRTRKQPPAWHQT
jgi:hypothetical protein